MLYVGRIHQYNNHRFHPDVLNPEEFVVMQDKAKFGVISTKDLINMSKDNSYPSEITCPWCKKKTSFDDSAPSMLYFELPDQLSEEYKQSDGEIDFETEEGYDWYALMICPSCRRLELILEEKEREIQEKLEQKKEVDEDV